MICDHISHISCYPNLKSLAPELLAFLTRLEEEKLPDGKYELRGEDLFASVQSYETHPKDATRFESHKLYADLQYIVEGKEWIYYDLAEELTVFEDRRPESDNLFYERRPDHGGNLLTAGMFGYYAPQDAHLPGVMDGEPAHVRKVVFKIRVAEK